MEDLLINRKVFLKGFSEESMLNGKVGIIEGTAGPYKEFGIVRFDKLYSNGAKCAAIPFTNLALVE